MIHKNTKYIITLVSILILSICSSSMEISPLSEEQQPTTNHTSPQITYPIRFTYIDRINQWWPAQKIAQCIGVPGFATNTIYNYIALAFWSYSTGPLDIVNIWADPVKYMSAESIFGKTKDQIQKSLKKRYNDAGVKILISAFGATEFPTTAGVNPIQCANRLGQFVMENNLDGVDIDWEDNSAMQAGTGQQWLITFQQRLRKLLPNHIITHAPQGPYFKADHYKNGAYVTVNKEVGQGIDFYNVQFYNQGDTKYDTYESLFLKSGGYFSGTSVQQIVKSGINPKKLVVGKPVTSSDASNTGWMDHVALGQATTRAYTDLGWYAGVMFWQYPSDLSGDAIKKSAGNLKDMCEKSKSCK